jgi:pimeloyl-ACP methyl ester carboxylesterase
MRETGSLLGLVYTYIQPPGHTTTVVYLHCNNSSQREGMYLEHYLRPNGLALFLFDFEGCGNSQGEYITLGIREADQLLKVLTLIRRRNDNKFVLWGRSMGATSLLRYLQFYGSENIVCGVVDSA